MDSKQQIIEKPSKHKLPAKTPGYKLLEALAMNQRTGEVGRRIFERWQQILGNNQA